MLLGKDILPATSHWLLANVGQQQNRSAFRTPTVKELHPTSILRKTFFNKKNRILLTNFTPTHRQVGRSRNACSSLKAATLVWLSLAALT